MREPKFHTHERKNKDYILVCLNLFATSWSPVQGVLPTVPDQETEETQPMLQKREQVPNCESNEKEKKCLNLYTLDKNRMSTNPDQNGTSIPWLWNISENTSKQFIETP
jgi:hypothetical protein